MTETGMTIHSANSTGISWQELMPWTVIFKTLSVAASPTIIVLALAGALLNPVGWRLGQALLFGAEQENDAALMETAALNASPYRAAFRDPVADDNVPVLRIPLPGPRVIFDQMQRRFASLFTQIHTGREFGYFLIGNLWAITIWSFIGLAICRVCLIRMTRNEYVGFGEAFRFAVKKWGSAITAIGVPLIGVAVLCIPTALLGLLMGFDWGVMLVGLGWFVVLAFAFLMVILLLGLAVGWPLMVASVATECQNSFDAMTRAYAYTFQRPIHLLFYILVAILFGGFCWMLVALVADGVVSLAYWSVSWGTAAFGSERIQMIQGVVPDDPSVAPMFERGKSMIAFWNAGVRTIAVAFIYGLFWCQASVIYLLLRKNVDDTEMDEIFVDTEARTFERPQLKVDEHGIPQIKPVEE